MTSTTQGRRPPTFAKVGKQRRYSYLTRDDRGELVRKWHDCIPLDAAAAKSLRGMRRG